MAWPGTKLMSLDDRGCSVGYQLSWIVYPSSGVRWLKLVAEPALVVSVIVSGLRTLDGSSAWSDDPHKGQLLTILLSPSRPLQIASSSPPTRQAGPYRRL